MPAGPEEMRLHELPVAAWVGPVEPHELVQVERTHLRQVSLTAQHQMAQLVIEADRCTARRQAEYERRLGGDRVSQPPGQRAGGNPVVGENGEAEMPRT